MWVDIVVVVARSSLRTTTAIDGGIGSVNGDMAKSVVCERLLRVVSAYSVLRSLQSHDIAKDGLALFMGPNDPIGPDTDSLTFVTFADPGKDKPKLERARTLKTKLRTGAHNNCGWVGLCFIVLSLFCFLSPFPFSSYVLSIR
jgi:hypothetical protein